MALGFTACQQTSPPSSITLTVEDPMGNFRAAAYQVGTGSWQVLEMTGTPKTGTFNLGGQTKYGVAVRCDSGEVKVTVIQATSTELANPKVVCSSPAPSPVPFTVNVSIEASLLADGDRVCVNNSDSDCQPAGNRVDITLNLEPGRRDLLVVLKDRSGMVKVAKVVRNVDVTDGGNASVSLERGDQLPEVSFTVPNPPPGYTSFFGPAAPVGYGSANGTASGSVNASPTSYRPVSGFGRGDLYVAVIVASRIGP
ncbi:MAG: peptidase S8 and S53 subtilisin kexin sedolisin, partial [Meiothermus sp.]